MTKALKIFLFVLFGLMVFYSLVGFLVIPWAITTKLPPMLSEQLGWPVTIQEARFNPFLFALQVEGFHIQESDGSPLVGFNGSYRI